MNGRTAKKLRKIALSLKLNPVTSYARDQNGAWALKACWRRAYLEAKALYKGAVAESGLVDLTKEREGVRAFHLRHVDSIKRQGEGPVEK